MPLITLMTDFGTADTYVGQMKGVIAGICPQTTVIDLTHQIPPQDVMAGALALDAAVDAFPPESIHVAVVDPGVGTERRAIAVQTDRCIFVGPDNGLFTLVLERMAVHRVVHLNNTVYHRGNPSATFHGRDVFAPVAAHLACDTMMYVLGETVENWQKLELPRPVLNNHGQATLHVLNIDRFGNVITDLTRETFRTWREAGEIGGDDQASIAIGQQHLRGIRRTYGDVEPGKPLAYWGSDDRLEVAVRGGSAATDLALSHGDTIILQTG